MTAGPNANDCFKNFTLTHIKQEFASAALVAAREGDMVRRRVVVLALHMVRAAEEGAPLDTVIDEIRLVMHKGTVAGEVGQMTKDVEDEGSFEVWAF